MSAKDHASSDKDTSATAVPESNPGSASLSESTPSILQASGTETAVTSSSQSPVQRAVDADDVKVDADHASEADIRARIEKKRLEHEQQRAMHQKAFEQQMALLEKQQREEEQHLLLQRLPNNEAGKTSAAAASAPTTPPNEAVTADPKSTAAGAAAQNESDAVAQSKPLSHLYRSMPSSRRQSGEARRSTDELASAVNALSIAGKASNHAAVKGEKGENFTPIFNEQFLFDDELDNEDSAFVKKYNLKANDGQFPVLAQRDTAEWPKFGGGAGTAAADAAGNAAGDTTASSVRGSVTSKSPPPGQGTPSMAASFGTSSGRQQSGFPLPSPSPRLSQTGRSSPAINAATFAGVASRQASGPGSPSPGLGGLSGDVGRSGGGSRFVNTAVSIPAAAAANLKNHNVAAATAAGGGAAAATAVFPSFNLGAFSGASTGSESPSRFGPYSPNSFDAAAAADARRGSRPSSGFFE